MVTRSLLSLLSVPLVLLAGCTAGSDTAGKAIQGVGAGAAFDADTGSIAGVVLTEDQLPIAGATVAILDAEGQPTDSVTTAESGVFFLNFVMPGTQHVSASAAGYETVSRPVEVVAGGVTEELVFQLAVLASDAPYHTTTIHPVLITGQSFTVPKDCIYVDASIKTCQGSGGCSDAAPEGCRTEVHYGHCGVKEGEWGFEHSQYGCDFGIEWQTLILELDSIPQTSTTGKGWSLTALGPKAIRAGCDGHPTDCGAAQNDGNPSAFRTVAVAPIYTWIDKAILAERGLTAPDQQCCDWVWRLFPGPCDIQDCSFPVGNVGIMQEQKATVYWTYFMREMAPEGWSAVQDG